MVDRRTEKSKRLRAMRFIGYMTDGVGLDRLSLELSFRPRAVHLQVVKGWCRSLIYGIVVPRHQWDSVSTDERDTWMRKLLDSLAKRSTAARKDGEITDKEGFKAFPLLMELMGVFTLDDGTPHTPASLTIFAADGLFKACLHERQFQVKLWASSPTLLGVYQALEDRLKGPEVDWRDAPSEAPPTRKDRSRK